MNTDCRNPNANPRPLDPSTPLRTGYEEQRQQRTEGGNRTSELEEQKPNLTMRKSREGERERKKTSNLKVTRSRRKGKENLRGLRKFDR